METARILLVDDERAILDMIELVLRKEGFREIEVARSGAEAVTKCQMLRPHIVVLDVMLPDLDGYEVCREIRRITDAPILFLTAKSSDLDKLLGFGVGGDDYITKPFNPLEVVARIKAHLRRQLVSTSPSVKGDGIFDYGRFKVNENSASLEVNGTNIPCPAREFQLLLFLCKHPNRVFSREQLYEQVWGEQSVGADNTVMVHIRRLREKIELDASRPKYLSTVRGLGYKLTTSSGEELS
jgi:two-component system, OmpR family, response regulator RegX3